MRDLIVQLSESLHDARTLEELVRPLLDMLQVVTGLESTYLTAVDLAAERQQVLYARNSGALRIDEGLEVPWRDTLCRRALEEDVCAVDDVERRWGHIAPVRALGLRAFVSVPVRNADGALYGTLCAASDQPRAVDPEALKIVRLFARMIGTQIERERLIARLVSVNAELAATALADPLTGLPNRRAVSQELTRMLARVQRDDRALVLAFIDLDDFKTINDRYGHEAGDRFLVAMAGALESALRGGDLVARIGGDEFVVAGTLPRETADAAAEVVRHRLQAATCGRFDIGDGRVVDYAGASVGVVLARPGEVDADALLARADRAMYAAKRERGTARD